jgi:hypothetical protein
VTQRQKREDVHESSDEAGADADSYRTAKADFRECWVGGLGIWVRQCACGSVMLWHCEEVAFVVLKSL